MRTKLTHRRHDDQLSITQDVILFADDDSNDNYGQHIWVLVTNLPAVTEDLILFAAEYYGCERDEAENLVNPKNIVCSAGAWDDRQFVSDLWQAMECGDISEQPGFRTHNGAVVIDRASVVIEKISQ